jgi:ABC-type uncharacterized transport system substrate-binding protein
LRQRLQDLGWTEGRRVVVEERFGNALGRLRTLADELVRLSVDVMVAVSVPAITAAKQATALAVLSGPEFFRDRQTLVDLIAQTRIPASYDWREFVEIGGLLAYGANVNDLLGRVAVFVDKILKDPRPHDSAVAVAASGSRDRVNRRALRGWPRSGSLGCDGT